MAITPWLHCADHRLAPICRSRSGSNVAVGDTLSADRASTHPALLGPLPCEARGDVGFPQDARQLPGIR